MAGDFGINLLDMPEDPTTTLTITGDLAPILPIDYDALGNVIVDPNTPSPGRNDMLFGSAGNDRIEGKKAVNSGQCTVHSDNARHRKKSMDFNYSPFTNNYSLPAWAGEDSRQQRVKNSKE